MLRKLSSAFSIESPGSPRMHPTEEVLLAGDGAAVAAAAATEAAAMAAETGAAEAAEPADGPDVETDTGNKPVADADVAVVVVPNEQEGNALDKAMGTVSGTPSLPEPLSPPPLRMPTVALTAAAGDAAAAAVAAGAGAGATDGGTPIAAYKKRGMRISFADMASVAPAVPGGMKPRALPSPRPSILGPQHQQQAQQQQQQQPTPTPRKSLTLNSLLAIPVYQTSRPSRHHSEETTVSDPKSSVFDLLERKNGKPLARWQVGLNHLLQSGSALLTSLTLTIMILYSDSLRQACTPKSADPYFLAFSSFVLVVFLLEAAAACLANPRYAKTFYFSVDIISSLSILLDIPAIMDPVVSSANDGNGDVQQRGGLENAAQITAAAARAARLAHVTKWMRLWRIMRLWTFYYKHKQFIIDRRTFFEAELEASSQSRLGEKLTELTIRKVVLMVLLVMFAMPVFDVSVGYYGGPPMLDNGGLSMLHASYGALGNSSAFQASLQVYLDYTPYRLGRGHTGSLTDLSIYGQPFVSVPGGVAGLRSSEYANFTAQSGPGCEATAGGGSSSACNVSYATFNVLWDSQIQGYLEIGRTTFIIIILLVGAIWFIADTDRLVLRPLERMVQLVKEVSVNPLAKVSQLARGSKGGGGGRGGSGDPARGDKALETQVLEASIHKICSLLSVGFGEAGAEVIADNIRSGGDLNPMVPGRKVAAIFGFCDIRSFTDATEVLQEDVMAFVNSIAQIVHHEVALHGGAANKNIGDAFLLVWKLPGSRREPRHASSSCSRSQGSGMSRMSRASSSRMTMLMGADRDPERKDETNNIADQALASFIIVQVALKRSAKLKAFCNREDLSKRLPGYQVNMGFGLHVGWAIEGAIGSEHKIDASYLSPHVNMASRLEAATKQYGAAILLSEDFVRMLSPGVRSLVRQVDCVTVKGSIKPIGLFTYDVDLGGLEGQCLNQQKSLMRVVSSSGGTVADDAAAAASEAACEGMQAVGSAGGRSECYETFSCCKFGDEFVEHPDIVMTRGADPEFLAKFATGFEAYRIGDWATARSFFLETLSMRRNKSGLPLQDGPSTTLLQVMAGHDFQAPASWPGHRELTEK